MTVTFNQSGYVGQSMSVRAARAYMEGELPASKITAKVLADWGIDEPVGFVKFLIRNNLLETSSWHHTGKFARETDFYSDESIAESLAELKDETFYKGRFHNMSKYDALKGDYAEVTAWKKAPAKWWVLGGRAVVYTKRPLELSAIYSRTNEKISVHAKILHADRCCVIPNGGRMYRPLKIGAGASEYTYIFGDESWEEHTDKDSAVKSLEKIFQQEEADFRQTFVKVYGREPAAI